MSARNSRPRILVTGGAGFLGGRIAEALAETCDVTLFDRVAGTRPCITGDIAELGQALPDGFAADAVIHAAAITTQASAADPEAAWRINVGGTSAVVAWCAAQPRPPRLVLLSSVGVFGGGEAEPDETSRPAPASVYGTSKVAAEYLVLDAARRGIAEGVVLRLPISVIRTTRHGPPGAGFLSDLVDHARRGRPFVAPLAADHVLPIASVRAAVALASKAALAPGPPALLHLPCLAVSGALAVAALAAEGIAACVRFAPEAAIEALVAGWPRRLATRHPDFSADLADVDVSAILRALPPLG